MAIDRRKANREWYCADEGGSSTPGQANRAVLMDIRDELRRLNRLLHCQNFIAIPRKLDAIHRKLPARKPKSTPRNPHAR